MAAPKKTLRDSGLPPACKTSSRRTARARRIRAARLGLQWWKPALFFLIFGGLGYWIWLQPVEESYFGFLEREGGQFAIGPRSGDFVRRLFAASGFVWNIALRLRTAGLPDEDVLAIASAWSKYSVPFEVKQFTSEQLTFAFVPDHLAFSDPRAKITETPIALKKTRGAGQKHLVMLALAAIKERRRGNTSAHARWLRALPKMLLFSHHLSADHRAGLQGTMAAGIIEAHDEAVEAVLSALDEPRVSTALGQPKPDAQEAAWAVGVALHHGVPTGDSGKLVLLPGLLDGVRRHWDTRFCAELVRAKGVAEGGRLLQGYGLTARRALKPLEEAFICSGRATNAQLLATWGLVHADNPNGPVLQPNAGRGRLEAALAAGKRVGCSEEEVSTLFLMHDPRYLLSQGNLRCSSLVWMRSVEEAIAAVAAGYFDDWPRNATFADESWITAEAAMYKIVSDGCNGSLAKLSGMADPEALARLRAAIYDDHLAAATLVVRDRGLRLYKDCARWAEGRAELLLLARDRSQVPTHEEL